jgi:hypothetical protein
MANEIDLVVGTAVKTQLDTLMAELVLIDKQIQDIGKSAVTMNTALGVKDTASLTKLTAENAKLNKEIEKLAGSAAVLETKLANLATAQARTAKATTDAAIAEEKLITATNKNTVAVEKKTKATLEETIAQREATNAKTLEIKAGQGLAQTYSELDARHKQAVKTAQDLAVSTGRTGQAYEDAKLKANEYGKQLRVIDTDIGKHTRNVGNYSSSWNGLGNSINQLTREAPAFANSVQTGFMALSNNIPILTDELGVLIQKNKDLQAEGKPTQSILKTVAGAFFSWQTAISLGVTILTVYGSKLVDMALGLGNVQKALKALEQAQKDSDARISDTTRNIEAQTALAIANAKMRGASQKQLDDLTLAGKKEVLLNLQKERDLAKKTYEEAVNYKNNGIEGVKERQRAELTAYNQSVAQRRKNGEQVSINEQMLVGRQMAYKHEQEIKKIKGNASEEGFKLVTDNYTKTEDAVKIHGQKLTVLTKELQASQFQANEKANNKADKEADKEADKLAEKEAKAEEERLKNAFNRKISDLEKQKELDSDSLNLFTGTLQEKQILSATLAADETLIVEAKYQEELRLAEGNADLIAIAENNKFKAINNIRDENIKRVQDMYSEEEKIQAKSLKKAEDAEKERLAKLAQYKKEVESYLNSFGTEFASKIGLSETFNMLSGNIAGFGKEANITFVAVAEAAQEMFNIIAESSAANYDAEYSRLNKQKEEAIKNAGDSTAAKEKIEADYDKKKKEIQLREFKAKQKITIANIAIDTAQAIVSTYAQVPKYDFGVSATTLAFIIAGLGAAQIGMVASQKPPAYADGTDNHSGGLMLVNDGSGSNFQEKVILPSGKVIRPQGRNVLMDAPKGTKVLNHEQQLFEMLQSNNISMSSQGNSGLTYDEMNEIFKQNLSNIKTQNTIFDKNGFQSYVKNGNSITRSNSNRSQAIGISV